MGSIQLAGFLPDVDPTTQGALLGVTNMIPTLRGYRGAPTPLATAIAALVAKCQGGVTIRKLDGSTTRTFAGTQTKIYEAVGSAWTDCSRAAAMDIGASGRWRFAQFGDATLAANKALTLQASTSGAFADVAGAPQANCIDTSQGFVMLADTYDGTYGDSPDRWWCSAIYDHTTWAPSVATQATTGRLVDAPGAIKAIKALGANFVAYKDSAVFISQYVGPPLAWAWTLIPGEVGCASQDAIVSIGSAHIFLGREDFYLFDGTRPVPIGEGIREWFFKTALNKGMRGNVQGLHDRDNACVHFFYPSQASSGALDSAIVFNYKTRKWGGYAIPVESVVDYQTPSTTIDTATGTIDAQAEHYDSPLFAGGSPLPAVINGAHTLCALTGDTGSCSMLTWDIGDDAQYSLLRRVKPRFTVRPASASMTNFYRDTPAGDMTTGDVATMDSSDRLDALREARWHRLLLSFTGNVEVASLAIDLVPGGTD